MIIRNVVVVVAASRISVSVSFLSQSFDSNLSQTNHTHPWKYGNVCWISHISFVRLLGMDLFFSRRAHVVPVCSGIDERVGEGEVLIGDRKDELKG